MVALTNNRAQNKRFATRWQLLEVIFTPGVSGVEKDEELSCQEEVMADEWMDDWCRFTCRDHET